MSLWHWLWSTSMEMHKFDGLFWSAIQTLYQNQPYSNTKWRAAVYDNSSIPFTRRRLVPNTTISKDMTGMTNTVFQKRRWLNNFDSYFFFHILNIMVYLWSNVSEGLEIGQSLRVSFADIIHFFSIDLHGGFYHTVPTRKKDQKTR